MKYFTKKMITPLSTTAELTGYVPDNSPEIDLKRKRPAVIICPGGAYRMTSDREAEAVAFKFLGMDLAAFVLRYSCAPARYPVALLELAESVRYVRAHAKEFALDPDKIIILGMSAGGHLAASLGTLWTDELFNDHGYAKEMIKPNGMILCYPVITAGEFSHSGSFDNLVGKDPKLREFLSLEKRHQHLSGIRLLIKAFQSKIVCYLRKLCVNMVLILKCISIHMGDTGLVWGPNKLLKRLTISNQPFKVGSV